MNAYPDRDTARYMDTSAKALALDIIPDVCFCNAEDMLTGRRRPIGFNWDNIPSQKSMLVELLFQRVTRKLARAKLGLAHTKEPATLRDWYAASTPLVRVQSIAPQPKADKVKKVPMSGYDRRKAKLSTISGELHT